MDKIMDFVEEDKLIKKWKFVVVKTLVTF